MRYSVVIEKGEKNYSAYLPDVPGCVATGKSPANTLKRLAKALEMQWQGCGKMGFPSPNPVQRSTISHLMKRVKGSRFI